MNFLNRILPYIIPVKRYAFLNIFFNFLYAIFSGLSLFLIMPLLKVIFNPENEINTVPVWNGELSKLISFLKDKITYDAAVLAEKSGSNVLSYIILAIVIVFLLKNIFSYLANYNMVFLREKILHKLRVQFYNKILELPLGYYSEKRKGDIMSRMSSDINVMQWTYLDALQAYIREPLTILGSLFIMVSTSLQLTLFILVFVPFASLIISKIGKTLKSSSRKAQEEQGIYNALLEETLSGLKIIKAFNGEKAFSKKMNGSSYRLFERYSKLQNKNNLASPMSEFLGIVVFSVLLWYGGNLVLVNHSLEGDEFIGFLLLAYNILTPSKQLSKASYNLKIGNASAERVFEIIDKETDIPEIENAINKTDFNTNIEFKNISFKYKDTYVLEDYNLTIPKAKTIALVGQSGSGKSTIANLVTRFYDINKGEILIDGTNIKNASKTSLRNLIGVVTQDAILFNDSIKNNLLLANEKASDEEIIDALKVANAWEFVKDLPQGIDTNIGEGGGNLSGGQKQRLSIARAVLKNPPIMILDEATSALDTESEKLVQDALEKMMKNRTSIVIAHRLSTIQNADNIVVMQQGKIIEQGNHQDLISENGMYRKLVEMQQL